MSIKLTDELEAATKKGKLASAKQVYLEGDQENLQQIADKTHQLENSIKDISASGGASTANAVSYNNEASGMVAVNAQAAIDELAAKNKAQDSVIDTKANKTDVEESLAKKFDKDSIAQEFGDSKDKVVSQFALPFREIESPEFLHCIVDAEDHFLFGIQLDGSVEWGKGIPAPIRVKLQEIINQSQQDKTDIIEAINAAKEELSTSIVELQQNKVDKEEGKSLIDDEVKECFKVIENEEFIHAITDAEDRLLFGIYRDTGKPYFPLNDMYHVEQNEEFFAVWLDAADHVLLGIRRDGQIIGEIHACNALERIIENIKENIENLDASLSWLSSVLSLQDTEEYISAETDAVGNILSATYNDGSHYSRNLKSETIPDEISHIEDPEDRMEITTDAVGNILSYRSNNGEKHEEKMDVDTLKVSNLNLQGSSVTNIQDALKKNGFDLNGKTDWSDSSFIQIPEPRFAIVNITNIKSMPTTKTENMGAFLEFWDMQGNYFKKHAILNAQGNSTMGWSKKNLAIDLCNDEWVGDDTPSVRFGKWVPQDSFHMKAYYTDFFKGVGAVTYKLCDEIARTRGNMYDRPWKKALLNMDEISETTKSFNNPNVGDFSLLTDTGARCFPDGFPVACYLNGEFYGIFSWQLKKHRDNYHMDKSTAEHVHLDGTLYEATIFNGKGRIDWSQFEIRNPKGLYAIGGNKYNADIRQEEIAGDTEVNAWIEEGKLPDGTEITSKIKKALQMTAKVKKYIQGFADAIPTIKSAMATYEESTKTEEDLMSLKEVYEKYFDVDNVIDYMIASDIVYNYDGFGKNWQWITYDGIKWWVCIYDCDMSFGGDQYYIRKVPIAHISTSTNRPHGYVMKYYAKEMEDRYKSLADQGIISSEHIFSLLRDWTMRIGTSFYKEEYEKWSNCPCIGNSVVREEYWELLTDEKGNPQTDTQETFDATTSYEVGATVSFGLNEVAGFYKFKCLKSTEAQNSNIPHAISPFSPIVQFKHCDSIYRAEKWIDQNIKNMDIVYNYSRNNY